MGINQRVQRTFGTLAIALFAVFATQTTASAHTELVSSAPAASESVNATPTTISLTFSEAPLLEGSAIVVTDEAGMSVDTQEVSLSGSTLSIPWPAQLSPGEIKVEWRTVADDGHPVSGDFKFNYTAAAEGGVAPSATPIASTTAEPTPAVPTIVTATPLAISALGDVPQEESGESGSSTRLILIGLIAAIGVGIGIYLMRRKK